MAPPGVESAVAVTSWYFEYASGLRSVNTFSMTTLSSCKVRRRVVPGQLGNVMTAVAPIVFTHCAMSATLMFANAAFSEQETPETVKLIPADDATLLHSAHEIS